MSLVKTLAKAAVGIAVAKGVGSVLAGSASAGSRSPQDISPGTGSPNDGLTSRRTQQDAGDISDVLGKILGGSGPRGRGSLGGALEELSQIRQGSFSENETSSPPGSPIPQPKEGSFGDLLNNSLDNYGEPRTAPTVEQEALAGTLLSALIQAAKSDGRIDPQEKDKLLKHLGDLGREELDFVNAELAKPMDVNALVRNVPKGSEGQVYMMSLMGIDLDSNHEARYLHELSQALGLTPQQVNAMHDRLGEPRLFR